MSAPNNNNTNSQVPASVKVALLLGTVAGTTVAIINNRERLLETAEYYLQKGVDYCHQKLDEEKEKMMYASEVEDHGFSSAVDRFEDEDDATTPEGSDWETDEFDLD
ncbi:hypothetical protein DICA4_F35410 [Diutina catenulata]